MIFLNGVIIGDRLNGIYCLKSLSPRAGKDGSYSAVFSDKSGELSASISAERFSKGLSELVGGPVHIDAVVIDGEDMKPELVIKTITPAQKDEYKPSDIFEGLSNEKIADYVAAIHKNEKWIKTDSYRQLCEAALSDITLERLSKMPATLSRHGRYQGGALAAAATVSSMAIHVGTQYITMNNGLYPSPIDWSLVITSSLLHSYGVLEYITPEPPYRKTVAGLNRGYMSTLQHSIEAVSCNVSDVDMSRLINTLACSVVSKTAVRSTSKEGMLLRHVLALYSDMDLLDGGVAGHEAEDGETYYYDRNLKAEIAV